MSSDKRTSGLLGLTRWQLVVLSILGVGTAIIVCMAAVLLLSSLQRLPSQPHTATTEITLTGLPPAIPGLTYSVFTDYLLKAGVSCPPPEYYHGGYFSICQGSSSDGVVKDRVDYDTGSSVDYICWISGTVFQSTLSPSDKVATDFLGYLATMPYTNANPSRARDWVTENLPLVTPMTLTTDFPTTTIGGVKFLLNSGNSAVRSLEIGQDCP